MLGVCELLGFLGPNPIMAGFEPSEQVSSVSLQRVKLIQLITLFKLLFLEGGNTDIRV